MTPPLASEVRPPSLSDQSKMASLGEATVNVVVGFLLSFAVQRLSFPMLGMETTMTVNATIAAVFTLMSLLRNYLLRRLVIHIERRRAAERVRRERSLALRLSSGKL